MSIFDISKVGIYQHYIGYVKLFCGQNSNTRTPKKNFRVCFLEIHFWLGSRNRIKCINNYLAQLALPDISKGDIHQHRFQDQVPPYVANDVRLCVGTYHINLFNPPAQMLTKQNVLQNGWHLQRHDGITTTLNWTYKQNKQYPNAPLNTHFHNTKNWTTIFKHCYQMGL